MRDVLCRASRLGSCGASSRDRRSSAVASDHPLALTCVLLTLRFITADAVLHVVGDVGEMPSLTAGENTIGIVIVRRCPQKPHVRMCPQSLMTRTPRSTAGPSHTFAGKSESKRLRFRRANDNDAVIVTVDVTIIASVIIHRAERFE